MALISRRLGPSRSKAALRFAAMLVLFLIVLGFISDMFSGLPILLSSRSWTAWLLGILALSSRRRGGNWIDARDKVTHPLWKRFWHLAVLLGWAVAVAAVAAAIIRLTQ